MTTSDKSDPSRIGDLRALTTLSPVRPERLAHLRRRLAVVSWTPGFARPLLELATIHFARWSILSWLPDPDGSGRRWPLSWSYLLFEASYDGDEAEYLETFADIVPLRLSELFGACFGFTEHVEDVPRAPDRVFAPGAFRRYVERNKLPVLHFGAANADLSVTAVRQAIAMERLEERGIRQRGAALGRTQHLLEGMALAPPPARPGLRDGVVEPWLRRARGDYGVNPLTVVAPLERPDDLAAGAPLAGLRDVHFARLALVGRAMQDHLGHPHPDRLECDYLLFTADHDGARDDFVERLRESGADTIFGGCARYPGAGDRWDFADWLRRHSVRTQYYLAGYPPRRVGEVGRLVAARRRSAQRTLAQRARIVGRP